MNKHPLEKVKWGVIPIVNYRGRLVTKVHGGYKLEAVFYRSPDDIDKRIDEISEVIEKSIYKQ